MQQDESNRIFRNHPSIIAGNIVSTVLVLAVLFLLGGLDEMVDGDLFPALAGVAAIVVLVAAWSFLVWRRTFYIFGDNEIHVTRDTVWKMDKHIQYTRLASVGVRRTIMNRVFGTSTLVFNVNSSVNAAKAEATLILERRTADRLRDALNSMIFRKEMTLEEDRQVESIVRVTNLDVVVHAILGRSTAQSLFAMLLLFYAAVMLVLQSSGGFITAVALFVLTEGLPFVSAILRYYNYRIFRVGDTITVESGLITTQRQSFNVNKVNSVRIREPLIARLLGKAVLEAEVVGLADMNDQMPLLCPMKRRSDVQAVLREVLPELVFSSDPIRQPRRALIPMLITDAAISVLLVVAGLFLFLEAGTHLAGWDATLILVVRVTGVLIAVLLPILVFGRSGMAQRHRTFDMGRDSFMLIYGGYDLCTEYVNYDKVQHTRVSAGPLQRAFGVSECSVFLMSSLGAKRISSGLFGPEDLELVADEVNARIRDGRYDYRRYYRRVR